jgi:hypothetical protein
MKRTSMRTINAGVATARASYITQPAVPNGGFIFRLVAANTRPIGIPMRSMHSSTMVGHRKATNLYNFQRYNLNLP